MAIFVPGSKSNAALPEVADVYLQMAQFDYVSDMGKRNFAGEQDFLPTLSEKGEKNFSRAVKTFPKSKNIEDRRGEQSEEDIIGEYLKGLK